MGIRVADLRPGKTYFALFQMAMDERDEYIDPPIVTFDAEALRGLD